MAFRLRTALLLGIAAAWAAHAGSPAAAHPHLTTPPVDLTISVRGDDVIALLTVDKWQLARWGEEPGFLPNLKAPLDPESVVGRLATRVAVEIDGALVSPVLVKLDEPSRADPNYLVPTLQVQLRFPVAQAPNRLRVTWLDFMGILWEEEAQVALQIEAQAHVDTALLTPAEPEYVWRRRPPAAFRTAAPPPAPPPTGPRVPLVALSLGLVAILLTFTGSWRQGHGRTRWIQAGLAGAAGAVAILGVGQVESPFGRPQPPTHAQARVVVTALVGNIYRAFDAETETGIYELVAASVEPTLLDRLYGDVYESLVLRQQGGAVCRVADVTFGALEIAFPSNGSTTQFDADARWTVKGVVSHLGHTHERVNEYRAALVVRHDGQAWRLAAVTMLENRRLDDGKPAEPDSTPSRPPPPPPPPTAGTPVESR